MSRWDDLSTEDLLKTLQTSAPVRKLHTAGRAKYLPSIVDLLPPHLKVNSDGNDNEADQAGPSDSDVADSDSA